jgi:UDPglucose 6-dehydrogenase
MNVCVIGGAGYVGLITGLCLSEIGHQVTNVDVDQDRVQQLQDGKCYVHEDGIEALLKSNLDAGSLSFTTDLSVAVSGSDIVFIAVGTPSQDDGQADLSQIIHVGENLKETINGYKVLVIKSTVPVGTVELLRNILERRLKEGEDFDIVVNPEFLREGKGLYDFFYPDRIVLGADSARANRMIKELYEPIVTGQVTWTDGMEAPAARIPVPWIETDPASAQMVKYASNAFLATQISFINEIAGVCEKVGADVNEVVRGMRHDPRVGNAYLRAGIGFGGPCLGKDLHSLITLADAEGYDPPLLRAVVERNERQVGEVVGKLKHFLGHVLYGKTIAAFGLAFKAGTNDVRNSLAIKTLDRLEQEGAVVRAHDPAAIKEARSVRPNFTYCVDPYETADDADAILILTEWPSFKELDFKRLKESMASPYIVDGRNLLDPKSIAALGFNYVGMGRS